MPKKVTSFLKRKLLTSEKITPSEEVDKGTKNMDYMEEPVVTIRRKDLDNFGEQSIGSTDMTLFRSHVSYCVLAQ